MKPEIVALWVELDERGAEWADRRLVAQRQAEGVLSATRFTPVAGVGPNLVLYEVEDPPAAKSLLAREDVSDDDPAALAWKNARAGHYRAQVTTDAAVVLADVPCLLAVRVTPSPEWVGPLRRWLHEEHFVRQSGMEGVRWCCGYEPAKATPHFLNVWGVDAPEIIDSPRWVQVRDTPWYERVRPAFSSGETQRGIYRPVS